jgi:hypothetical protein
MTLSTTYQLIHKQSFLEQEIINVYFYDHVAGTGLSGDLGLAWQSNILPAVNILQTSALQNEGIEVINLGVTTDFSILTGVGGGGGVGDALPPQDALSYTFKSSDRAIRPGGKRYAGVPESAQVDGEITLGGYLTGMEGLRVALAGNIVSGGDTWQPVLVKRIKTAVPGTTPTQYTYRLPRAGDTFLSTPVLSVLVSKFVKSQVSRKR